MEKGKGSGWTEEIKEAERKRELERERKNENTKNVRSKENEEVGRNEGRE